ncbi:hypothetical protein ACXHXG_20530 [Rhizobium sp. LEGMi198b]
MREHLTKCGGIILPSSDRTHIMNELIATFPDLPEVAPRSSAAACWQQIEFISEKIPALDKALHTGVKQG